MKALVVDDDPLSLRLLRNYLEKWGYEVTQATDGAAAWALLQEDDYPLVIADWMMPEMDGVDLVRRIRATSQPGYVYCILLTARSQKEDLVEGMDAGADDFLSKPFDRDELRVRLREGERIVTLERAAAGTAAPGESSPRSPAELGETPPPPSMAREAQHIQQLLNAAIECLARLDPLPSDSAAEVQRTLRLLREAKSLLENPHPRSSG